MTATTDPTNICRADATTPQKSCLQPRPQTRSSPKLRLFIIVAALALSAFIGARIIQNRQHASSAATGTAADAIPVPVIAGLVEKKDVPIYLDGIGTVQAFNT